MGNIDLKCVNPFHATAHSAFTCSKLTIETEQGVKYVQS